MEWTITFSNEDDPKANCDGNRILMEILYSRFEQCCDYLRISDG